MRKPELATIIHYLQQLVIGMIGSLVHFMYGEASLKPFSHTSLQEMLTRQSALSDILLLKFCGSMAYAQAWIK